MEIRKRNSITQWWRNNDKKTSLNTPIDTILSVPWYQSLKWSTTALAAEKTELPPLTYKTYPPSLLYFWNVSFLKPFLINKLSNWFSFNFDVFNAWILSGWMVSKNHNSLDFIIFSLCLFCNLTDSSVMIKSW